MKMAKANRADMEAALDMCAALEALQRGYLPQGLCDQNSQSDDKYEEQKHAEMVVNHLIEIAARGSLFRVCFGMTVLLDPRNEVVDQEADTLALHPAHVKRPEVDKATRRLLAALDGMDRGCREPGFRGHQNGLGEESGNELQDAREELVNLIGHVPSVKDEEVEQG